MPGFRQLASNARKGGGKTARRAGLVTRADVNQLAAELGRLREQLTVSIDGLVPRIEELERRLYESEQREQVHVQLSGELRTLASIAPVSRWIRQAKLAREPLISVVTPTLDRPALLERAIRSVVAQRYRHWELLVVYDRDDDAPTVVDASGDDRVRALQNPGPRGECAPRNHALRSAGGELIAYLDDDNTMDPDWLYAVAWAFEQRPEIDVLYGAHVIDDHTRMQADSSGMQADSFGALPWTFLREWRRETLRQHNLTDMSAIAHRAGLPGAWFDEQITAAPDWDLLLRLTADKDPLVLPVVACYYRTDAPDRISAGPSYQKDYAATEARAKSAP